MRIEAVLLVDDEPDIRRIGQISLRNVGRWEVLVASGGAEALSIALARRPDVVLLDVMMPELDGPSTLELLRREPTLAGVPVVFMTAKAARHETDRLLSLGAAGVIHKPFDPLTLPAQVRRIVGAD